MRKITRVTDHFPREKKGYAVDFVVMSDGTKGVWKYQLPGSDDMKLRYHIQLQLYREIAAYRLDQAMGFDVIPKTTLASFRGINGSLQNFIEGDNLKQMYREKESVFFDLTSMRRLALFDYIVGNFDRWSSNVIVDASGKAWGIDNSAIFYITNSSFMPCFHYLLDRELDNDLKELIIQARKNVSEIVKAMVDLSFEEYGTKTDLAMPIRLLWWKIMSLASVIDGDYCDLNLLQGQVAAFLDTIDFGDKTI